MIIKKFKAQTEKEATAMAREELGANAIVMNVKTIKPKGLMRLFKKTTVELTAAIDDAIAEKSEKSVNTKPETSSEAHRFGKAFVNTRDDYSEDAKNAIEEKINTLARLLDQQDESVVKEREKKDNISMLYNKKAEVKASVNAEINSEINSIINSNMAENTDAKEDAVKKEDNKIVALVKRQLEENEVSEKNADIIISELETDGNQALDVILSSVYQKIVLKLGQIEPLKASEKKPKIVFFVGNTGVGKTTTMAKIASRCKLENKMNIAMMSVDTYRIAAIEQIKTYANILSTPMEVVYTPEDMRNMVEKYEDCDVILVDTAGRSHTNSEQKNDLKSIIDSVEGYDKEVYLVVSATTKYSDLISISKTYEEMFDFKLIFTKLDETRGIGNILNLKLDTGKALSYVTWGQNVPEDIGEVNPQIIAKKLLGGAS